jgi:two-component system sensor histidine kinase YesM
MEHKTAGIYRFFETKSLRGILVFSFIFVSIIPILVLQYVSYHRLSRNFEDNVNRLSQVNVNQTKNNLEIILAAYEDLLYQLYTNDELVSLLADIDANTEFFAVNMNHVRTTLRAMCYAKEAIESITVITNGGNIIIHDKITGTNVSSWLGKEGLDPQEVFERGMSDYNTKIIPTHYVYDGAKPYYLFHLMHRIIDYKHITRDIGIVVLTLNEELLQNICNAEMVSGSLGFIVDDSGRIISYPGKDKIGTFLPEYDGREENFDQSLHQMLRGEPGFSNAGDYVFMYAPDSQRQWRVVAVIDQSPFYDERARQLWIVLFTGLAFLILTGISAGLITSLLSRSMNKVTTAMKQAEGGDLSVLVEEKNIFSLEIMTIVRAFNAMMERIAHLVAEIKIVSKRQRDAEIKAMEAQINPHFLYNMLDSISWMAIEKDQFEISRMITSLAKILRYSISRSNTVVSLGEEVNWLKQYLYLQQIRYKNNFECHIDVDESLLEYPTHKLLFQPFIENSINHGFKGREGKNFLQISIWKEEDVFIRIRDNGRGMDTELLEKIKNTAVVGEEHMGMANAMGRINMYYGKNAELRVESAAGKGTTVTIRLKARPEAV